MSTLYRLRNAVFTPQIRYRRWRHRHFDTGELALLEHFHYRTSFLRHLRALMAQPDLIHDFDLEARSTVLDVGGHEGRWCRGIAERSDVDVHVFEPSSVPLRQLRRTTRDLDNVTIHRFGLGARTFTATLSEKGPGSSVVDRDDAASHQQVEIRDVIEVLDELGLVDIALAKINIEGGEFDLLDRLLDSGRISQFDVLLVQFHEWIPGAYRRRRRIRRRLRRTHDEIWNHDWIWECWERRVPVAVATNQKPSHDRGRASSDDTRQPNGG